MLSVVLPEDLWAAENSNEAILVFLFRQTLWEYRRNRSNSATLTQIHTSSCQAQVNSQNRVNTNEARFKHQTQNRQYIKQNAMTHMHIDINDQFKIDQQPKIYNSSVKQDTAVMISISETRYSGFINEKPRSCERDTQLGSPNICNSGSSVATSGVGTADTPIQQFKLSSLRRET